MIGIIGYGSMGGMLARGFVAAQAVPAAQLCIAARSAASRARATAELPGATVTADAAAVARQAGLLFLCVKPLETLPLLRALLPALRTETHLVSLAAGVTLADLGEIRPGRNSKCIPSVTAEVRDGVALLCHDPAVPPDAAARCEQLLGTLATVVLIAERHFALAADLTSCAPGLLSAIADEYLQAALRAGELDPAQAEHMLKITLRGWSRLLLDQSMDFSQAIGRVATKGGITEQGVGVLRTGLPAVFDALFAATAVKHRELAARLAQH